MHGLKVAVDSCSLLSIQLVEDFKDVDLLLATLSGFKLVLVHVFDHLLELIP